MEVLIAIPITIVFAQLAATFDRSLRFRLLYPFAVFSLGVLIPLYIVLENEKMTQVLKQNYETLKSIIAVSYQKMQRCKKSSVSPISVMV